MPAGSALTAFASAESAAKRGDAHAGFVMYLSIARCQEQSIAVAAREAEEAQADEAEYRRLLDRNEQLLRDCEGIGVAEIARGFEGLRLAAQGGDIEAQLRYAAVGYDEFGNTKTEMIRSPEKIVAFRENAMRFLHEAAARGSSEAIGKLAGAYARGVVTSPDPVKAYAYQYAHDSLYPPNPDGQQVLESYSRKLNDEQVAEAKKQALQILTRCCR